MVAGRDHAPIELRTEAMTPDEVKDVHRSADCFVSLTRGEGVLESGFARYQAVRGLIPARPRTDRNPLNRTEYLLQVQRGARGGG